MYVPSRGLRAVHDEHVRWHLERAAQRRMIKEAAEQRGDTDHEAGAIPPAGALTTLLQRLRRQVTGKRSRQVAPRP